MDFKRFLLPAFIIIAIIQLGVPAQMVLHRQHIIKNGEKLKFRTDPISSIDKNAKYLKLSFKDNSIKVRKRRIWKVNETVHVLFSNDTDGFAVIEKLLKEPPQNEDAFLTTQILHINDKKKPRIIVDFPFDQFYLEEYDLTNLESKKLSILRDSINTPCAFVAIKDGEAILQELFVNDKPFGDWVKKFMSTGKEAR